MSQLIIDNDTRQIVADDKRSGVQRFRDWYLPHAEGVLRRWAAQRQREYAAAADARWEVVDEAWK